jgi:Flp pilus assembly protein TadB
MLHMGKSKQNLYIGILFLGLILLSAGIGAMAAGEMVFGLIFLIGGVFFIGLGAMILILVRSKQQARMKQAEPAESADPPEPVEQADITAQEE